MGEHYIVWIEGESEEQGFKIPKEDEPYKPYPPPDSAFSPSRAAEVYVRLMHDLLEFEGYAGDALRRIYVKCPDGKIYLIRVQTEILAVGHKALGEPVEVAGSPLSAK
jgi:hypothetical protein